MKEQYTCANFGKCGGCKHLKEDYSVSLKKKEKKLIECIGKFGKVDGVIGMEKPLYYRHKVHAVFGEDRKHNVICGTYEEKSHRIVPVESCLLENQKADAIIQSIRKMCKSFKIRPFNEDTGYGYLRHVQIRVGYHTGEIMVVLVVTSPVFPSKNNFVKALRSEHPEISTIVLNVNDRQTTMVMGKRNITLYGKGTIEDSLLETTFRISPSSFYQINPKQTEVLYGKAMEFAKLTKNDTVIDAYCGTGTIGIIAAKQAGRVIGAELNAEAVKDAVFNAKRNEIKNIIFYAKDAGAFMIEMAGKGEKVDTVFMDPPRSGSSKEFCEALFTLKPKRIVYVSCNPETLGRDLEILTKHTYKMTKAVGVDMFPWTDSIEAVVALER